MCLTLKSKTQTLALRYAESLLEDTNYLDIHEMFENELLTDEERKEIWAHMSKITLDYPREWDK